MRNGDESWIGCIAIIVALVAAVAFGNWLINGTYAIKLKAEAIEYGYAQHNPKTGEWEWIKPSKAIEEKLNE